MFIRIGVSARPNVEDGAGHVGRIVRHQPDNGVGDFLGAADALHRNQMGEPLRAIGIAAGGVDLGVDQAGANRGDADALVRDLLRRPMVKESIAPLDAA